MMEDSQSDDSLDSDDDEIDEEIYPQDYWDQEPLKIPEGVTLELLQKQQSKKDFL